MNTASDIIEAIDELARPGEFAVEMTSCDFCPIRAKSGECPVCWLARKLGKNPDNAKMRYWAVRIAPQEVQRAVADSADFSGHWLRAKLLKACKLA